MDLFFVRVKSQAAELIEVSFQRTKTIQFDLHKRLLEIKVMVCFVVHRYRWNAVEIMLEEEIQIQYSMKDVKLMI